MPVLCINMLKEEAFYTCTLTITEEKTMYCVVQHYKCLDTAIDIYRDMRKFKTNTHLQNRKTHTNE